MVNIKNHFCNHEYYANAETCRDRWFDTFTGLQNEDYHLDWYDEYDNDDEI